MKILKFNDTTTLEFSDESNIHQLSKTVKNFGEIDTLIATLNSKDLTSVEFDGQIYKNIGILTVNSQKVGNEYFVYIVTNCQFPNYDDLTNQITELQQAVAMMAAGGTV